ncbi:aminoglycoside phosphotransferase family protein [Phyllobacterium myrsinacearum]|uniref:Aminoglycoside phosphotransferase (APT) family kinase protein n=1 Tax=Phyllobacterium myrsinacearum TaxID=28101 RepID=A0A839EJV5_9HYPH|nr:aminoglycoside phosphotransferase family protein [Phyllobacterium myrsinacearum]MBA8880693.1 aminoglycoside phosphotransferase (APT) family kinase protein [Phyllobacterium myrsinacearum]
MSNEEACRQPPVIDVALVKGLITAQFPQWADLPVRPVEHGGWDNRTFHLGDGMTVRLPSSGAYAEQVQKEQFWLPKLALHLPLPIPAPVAMGLPDQNYPWRWSIYKWLDGDVAKPERIVDLKQFAADLAAFLVALQAIDAIGGPIPGMHNFHRGGSLAVYDGQTREAIIALRGKIDTDLATEIWEAALVTAWQGSPVWFHGDVSFGNLLVREGRLSAVIDFGTSGVGDPSCDLAIAWTLFSGESRQTFRAALPLDEATWARGRGWTLWKALIVYAGLAGTDPLEAHNSRRVLKEVLADHKISAKPA